MNKKLQVLLQSEQVEDNLKGLELANKKGSLTEIALITSVMVK